MVPRRICLNGKIGVIFAVFSLLTMTGCAGGDSQSSACSTIRTVNRIAGGNACSDGQSNVAFILGARGNEVSECTGAYISTTSVLTAAHCFSRRPQEVLVASQGFIRSGVSYFVHPLYDGTIGSAFDMAILKVDQPISAAPMPVLLSTAPEVGDEVVAYGYGLDQNGRAGLTRVADGEVPLRATYSSHDGYRNGVVVIRSTGEGSPCAGDSGGPVLARSPNGDYGIFGITIAGPEGCSAEAGRPVTLASTQSQAALSFITSYVPDMASN